MGSPNFASSEYHTLGYVPPPITEHDIEQYRRECLDDEQNDPGNEWYISDLSVEDSIAESVQLYVADVASDLSELAAWTNRWMADERFNVNPEVPFAEFRLEYGYHDGARLIIDDDFGEDLPDDWTPERAAERKSFVIGFLEYVMSRVSIFTGLSGICGGYTGSEYTLPVTSVEDDKRYEALYDKLLPYLNFHAKFQTFSLDVLFANQTK